jgi:hypothetical protein
MSFDDDRVRPGERGDGVASCDGEGEGEVAGTKDSDWADGEQSSAKVGSGQGLAVGESAVYVRLEPGAGADEICEETDLVEGTGALPGEAGEREAGFAGGAFEQSVAERVDLIGYLKQKVSDLVRRAS